MTKHSWKTIFRILAAVAVLSVPGFGQSQNNWVLYEDFSQGNRPNHAPTDTGTLGDNNDPNVGHLWQLVVENCATFGCNPNQTLSFANPYLADTLSAAYNSAGTGWAGYYYRNEPEGFDATTHWNNDPYNTKFSMMTGAPGTFGTLPTGWNPLFTNMRFSFRCNVNVPSNPGQGYVETLGTYVKNTSAGDTTSNGTHYYHYMDIALYANQWTWLDFDETPTHLVGDTGTPNYPNDPQWGTGWNTHYWNGMAHWYWSMESDWFTSGGPWECDMGKVYFKQKNAEVFEWVQSTAVTYNPTSTRWEVMFEGPKNFVTNYQVAYSYTASLHANGFSSGTSGGTVSTPGSGYANAYWNSPSTTQPNIWIAFRPVMPVNSVTAGGGAIEINTSVGHGMATGDTVNVAGVCSGANGNQTITVVDAYDFTLNGTSGSCSYSSGGTVTPTSNTTNFAEVFSGDPASASASVSGALVNSRMGNGVVR